MTEEQLRQWYEENGLLFGQKVFQTANGFWVQAGVSDGRWMVKSNAEEFRRLAHTYYHTFEDAEAALVALADANQLTEVPPGT